MSQFLGNTGTLIIVVTRARGLPNKRKLEKQNPYCLLRLANLTDKTNADLRGGQVPRWDCEFRFHLTPEMSPLMKLSVLDETKKAPTLIAEAEIDFTPVFYASVKEGFDKWHTLYSGDGREAGEIYMEMTFYPVGGSTTFSSSGRQFTSSYGSNASSSSSKKRQLPPLPGQEPMIPIEVDLNAIPAPLPRKAREPLPVRYEPNEPEYESMNRSQMSIHTLPDIPAPQRELPDYPPNDRVSSSNAFDELEREVQLNYDGPVQKRVPPPVPSHSGSFGYKSLAPPRESVYDIIEPMGSKSPTRKPPSDFYKSGSSPKRLDLSIPYDANDISTDTRRDDVFKGTSSTGSMGSGRMSPSRFKRSLP